MSGLIRRAARIISWAGHPLVFVTVTVVIVLLRQSRLQNVFPLIAALLLALIAPMAVLLVLGVRSGRWRDADVSVREERRRFFPIAIPLSAAGSMAIWLAGAPGYIMRGAIVTLALLIAAAVINLRFKISLHLLFAAFCATVLLRVNSFAAAGAILLTLLVFWSRLYLTRHTFAETLAGSLVGALGGYVVAWLPG